MPATSKKKAPVKVEIELEQGSEEEGEQEAMDMEEVREGAMSYGKTNRKRSAKGAKNTTPAKDGYSMKKPMDAECPCGMKGRKGKCDGSCGKKMDSALTPQEYLAACDLGVQGRSRSYIRARLDSAQRLDLKCGAGSISEGEKCTKGAAQKVQKKPIGYANPSGRPLSNRQIRQIERKIVNQEATTGKRVKMSPEQVALLMQTPGTQSRKFVASQLRGATSKELKTAITASANTADPLRQAVRRVAKREVFNRRVSTAVTAGALVAPLAYSLLSKRDSVYASGFTPDQAQLAI